MTLLQERLSQPDINQEPDWHAAYKLNEKTSEFPEKVKIINKKIGYAEILEALGPEVGTAFLNSLEQSVSAKPVLKYVLELIKNNSLDVGNPILRNEIVTMRNNQEMPQEIANSILSIGEERTQQSWAEYHGIFVDARAVGLARGAKP